MERTGRLVARAIMSASDGMDPRARRFLAMVSVGASDMRSPSVEERRRSFENLMRWSSPPVAAIDTRDESIAVCRGTAPVRIYAATSSPQILPGLIYFHGGGLVAGSLDTHDALCRCLVDETGCRLISVGYRLAPEHPFPVPILDALLAARHILRHASDYGLEEARIAVAGDSGGATLATIVAQVLRARIKAQVLLCPVLDFGEIRASRRVFGFGFLLDEATMASDLAHYAPRRPLDDPRLSPLRARVLSGVPPAVIHTAGYDPLRDEGAAYAARLEQAGVLVTYRCHDALIHHFYGLTGIIPAARDALSLIARDIKDVLG